MNFSRKQYKCVLVLLGAQSFAGFAHRESEASLGTKHLVNSIKM